MVAKKTFLLKRKMDAMGGWDNTQLENMLSGFHCHFEEETRFVRLLWGFCRSIFLRVPNCPGHRKRIWISQSSALIAWKQIETNGWFPQCYSVLILMRLFDFGSYSASSFFCVPQWTLKVCRKLIQIKVAMCVFRKLLVCFRGDACFCCPTSLPESKWMFAIR